MSGDNVELESSDTASETEENNEKTSVRRDNHKAQYVPNSYVISRFMITAGTCITGTLLRALLLGSFHAETIHSLHETQSNPQFMGNIHFRKCRKAHLKYRIYFHLIFQSLNRARLSYHRRRLAKQKQTEKPWPRYVISVAQRDENNGGSHY
jgi:hypothetical protein